MRITKKRLRGSATFFVVVAGVCGSVVLEAQSASDPKRVLATVDYIGRDYEMAVARDGGRILSEAEFREMTDLSQWVAGAILRLEGGAGSNLPDSARSLEASIRERRPVKEIQEKAVAFRQEIIRRFQIATAPSFHPDLQKGKRLYEQSCAVCHGLNGKADTPTAEQLNPRPSSFADGQILDRLSPFQAFNTITFGLEGTAMPSFEFFSEEERWAVASYLFLLPEGLPEGEGKVVASTALDTTDTTRAAGLLRSAVETLRKSRLAYEGNNAAEALDLAISSYLDGFEPVESLLNSLGRSDLRLRVEKEFINYRAALRRGEGVHLAYDGLEAALEEARGILNESRRLSPSLVFLASLSIVAREGVEAILLLAIILSVLRSGGLPRYRTAVHGGWSSALVAGALSWLAFHDLVSGRFREGMEGWIGLLAAAVLIYVSFWLIARRDAERWKNYLTGRIRRAGRWGIWTAAGIAFLAVYREAFETVLFLEALRLQAPAHWPSLASGALAGAALLVAVAWVVLRLGKFIPLNVFFGLSGALLYFLAVVFVGQGVHSLQEAAILPQTPFAFVTVPTLGIFSTVEGVSAQGALILLFMSSLVWQQLVKTPREETALQREVTHVSAELLGIHELGEHLLEHLRDLREKLGRSRASEGVMKEIIGHMEDMDREIHQVILRLAEIYREIPRRFLEIYQGVEELERSEEKEKLLEQTKAFRAHLESLK